MCRKERPSSYRTLEPRNKKHITEQNVKEGWNCIWYSGCSDEVSTAWTVIYVIDDLMYKWRFLPLIPYHLAYSSAVQEHKNDNIQKYNSAHGSVWVWNLLTLWR
jgi:hypothetical protein